MRLGENQLAYLAVETHRCYASITLNLVEGHVIRPSIKHRRTFKSSEIDPQRDPPDRDTISQIACGFNAQKAVANGDSSGRRIKVIASIYAAVCSGAAKIEAYDA